MKYLIGFIFLITIGLSACSDPVESIEIDEISFSFINEHVLTKSNSDNNLIFFVAGKSCFVCSADIVKYINAFEPGKFNITVIGNDPQVGEALERKSTYLEFDQLELERHGFKMSNSEIYIFSGEALIYKNVVIESEFDAINAKTKELNE